MSDFRELIAKAATGAPLSRTEAVEAFSVMMTGEATPAQIGGFLMALRVRGETVDEIAGGVEVMRARSLKVVAPPGAIDTCGTGGDAKGTLNVSTAVAIVAAACGVPVAKHGNKALSSRSGSADVLQLLGVRVDLSPDRISACIARAGVGFMMAPLHHAAMKHVAPVRGELGTRTIFNLMGPLSNPAGVRRQLVGVFAERWLEPVADVLRVLGSEKVWVVHGADGLDEITTTGVTKVVTLDRGRLRHIEITPEDAGLPRARLDDLLGGEPAYNAQRLRELLAGGGGPYRDIVLLNSAAALIVADKVADLPTGVAAAAKAIDSGGAADVLKKLVAVSNE